MAIRIRTTAAVDSSLANGLFPPVSNGLVGSWDLRGTIAQAKRNLVSGVNASVIGSPVVASNGVTMTGNQVACLDTLLPETDDLTWFIVATVVTTISGNTAAMVANYRSTAPSGFGMFLRSAASGVPPAPAGRMQTAANFGASSPGTSVVPEVSSADAAKWTCWCSRVAFGVGIRIDNLTDATFTSTANLNARQKNTANTYLLGSLYTASYPGQVKMLAAHCYNRRLSDEDMATMHTWIAARALAVDAAIVV